MLLSLWITVDNLSISTQVIHRIHRLMHKLSVDNLVKS